MPRVITAPDFWKSSPEPTVDWDAIAAKHATGNQRSRSRSLTQSNQSKLHVQQQSTTVVTAPVQPVQTERRGTH